MNLSCETCNKEFIRPLKEHTRNIKLGKHKIFCSVSCWGKNRRNSNVTIRACLNCGTNFQSTLNKYHKKCCSVKCATKYAYNFVDVDNISRGLENGYISGRILPKRKYKNCPVCNKVFFGSKKTCSSPCAALSIALNRDTRAERISKTRKRLFSEGKLKNTGGTTKWIRYKNIKVQGSYEYRTCFILDKKVEVGEIVGWEYTNDRVEYTNVNGKRCNYLLDFKVFTVSEGFFYIETKGRVKENDALKWRAVEDRGDTLNIWFLKDILREEKFYGLVAPM